MQTDTTPGPTRELPPPTPCIACGALTHWMGQYESTYHPLCSACGEPFERELNERLPLLFTRLEERYGPELNAWINAGKLTQDRWGVRVGSDEDLQQIQDSVIEELVNGVLERYRYGDTLFFGLQVPGFDGFVPLVNEGLGESDEIGKPLGQALRKHLTVDWLRSAVQAALDDQGVKDAVIAQAFEILRDPASDHDANLPAASLVEDEPLSQGARWLMYWLVEAAEHGGELYLPYHAPSQSGHPDSEWREGLDLLSDRTREIVEKWWEAFDQEHPSYAEERRRP
jgi:hypothetical protein